MSDNTNTPSIRPGTIFKIIAMAIYLFGALALIIMISRSEKYGDLSFSVLHEQSVMLVFILGAIFHAAGSIISAIHASAASRFLNRADETKTETEKAAEPGQESQNNYALIVLVIIVIATVLVVVVAKAG